jgi:hypothetical protein
MELTVRFAWSQLFRFQDLPTVSITKASIRMAGVST